MRKSLFIVLIFFCQAAFSQYRIIAYTTSTDSIVARYPVEKLTHIIFSFLRIKGDTLAFANDNQRRSLQGIVAFKKKYPQLKIIVSIGGWGGCYGCSSLFSSKEHRKNFARTTVELFRQFDIDGLDLDWEYPAIDGYPGHPFKIEDKDNFTALLLELRKEMGEKYLLSFAAGGFIRYLENSIDWKNVMPLVDMVNIMSYDLVGGYSRETGHHTPLYSGAKTAQSADRAVKWLIKNGVDASKLIMGSAFYARVWKEVPPAKNGLYQPGIFMQGIAFRQFHEYFGYSSGFTYHWDKKAKAGWQYAPAKKLFATFDDERSITEKSNYIKKQHLGGIMFWELSHDKEKNGLIDLIHQKLNQKP